MNKKFQAILVIVFLICYFVQFQAFAEGEKPPVNFTIETDSNVHIGDTFSAYFAVDNTDKLFTLQARMYYDPDVVSLNATKGWAKPVDANIVEGSDYAVSVCKSGTEDIDGKIMGYVEMCFTFYHGDVQSFVPAKNGGTVRLIYIKFDAKTAAVSDLKLGGKIYLLEEAQDGKTVSIDHVVKEDNPLVIKGTEDWAESISVTGTGVVTRSFDKYDHSYNVYVEPNVSSVTVKPVAIVDTPAVTIKVKKGTTSQTIASGKTAAVTLESGTNAVTEFEVEFSGNTKASATYKYKVIKITDKVIFDGCYIKDGKFFARYYNLTDANINGYTLIVAAFTDLALQKIKTTTVDLPVGSSEFSIGLDQLINQPGTKLSCYLWENLINCVPVTSFGYVFVQ